MQNPPCQLDNQIFLTTAELAYAPAHPLTDMQIGEQPSRQLPRRTVGGKDRTKGNYRFLKKKATEYPCIALFVVLSIVVLSRQASIYARPWREKDTTSAQGSCDNFRNLLGVAYSSSSHAYFRHDGPTGDYVLHTGAFSCTLQLRRLSPASNSCILSWFSCARVWQGAKFFDCR
jgi:hypothetical protein